MKILIILRRLKGLIYKETKQIFRDPSSLLIAFVIPAVFLFLYGFGLSLDIKDIKIGIVMEDTSPEAQSFVRSFINSKYYDVRIDYKRNSFEKQLIAGEIKSILVIPQDFSQKLNSKDNIAPVQLITDGSDPNTATLVQNYTQSLWQNWLLQRSYDQGFVKTSGSISLDPRIWFNPQLESSNTFVPGIIAIVMALVGTLLTSLVVAREWERGTMESLIATPVSIVEIILAKIIPYFILGIISMILTVIASILLFSIPFRGSIFWLLISGSLFMFVSLGLGLLISTVSKNQFVASQISIFSAFLPTFILSGFIFEISSMPYIVRLITNVIPAKYFIDNIRTTFLVGTVPDLFIPNVIIMFIIGVAIFIITASITVGRLD